MRGVGGDSSVYLKHTRRGKCRAGARFVVNFILIVTCFARTFFVVARVLLIAELSELDDCTAHAVAHVASAKGGCARLVAHIS